MKASTIVFAALSITFLPGSGLIGLLALRNERLTTPVFEKMIGYDNGFSFTNLFNVSCAGVYWVEAVCERTNVPGSTFDRIASKMLDQLPFIFAITSDEKILAEGDSTNRGGSSSNQEISRHMATFEAEPGKSYTISFRNNDEDPIFATAKPILRIKLSQRVTIGNILLHSCTFLLARILAAVGLLFAISPCFFLAQRVRHRYG